VIAKPPSSGRRLIGRRSCCGSYRCGLRRCHSPRASPQCRAGVWLVGWFPCYTLEPITAACSSRPVHLARRRAQPKPAIAAQSGQAGHHLAELCGCLPGPAAWRCWPGRPRFSSAVSPSGLEEPSRRCRRFCVYLECEASVDLPCAQPDDALRGGHIILGRTYNFAEKSHWQFFRSTRSTSTISAIQSHLRVVARIISNANHPGCGPSRYSIVMDSIAWV
jgi:hypothetical protein